MVREIWIDEFMDGSTYTYIDISTSALVYYPDLIFSGGGRHYLLGSLWENLTYGTKVDVLPGVLSEHERYVWTTALAMGLAHVYFDEWMAVSRQVPTRARTLGRLERTPASCMHVRAW